MRVAMLDDEQKALDAMDMVLRMAAIEEVISETSWVTLREELMRNPADILLLDILMPGIDGMTVLAECRSRFQSMPVVMITGVNEIASAVASIKAGAVEYLVKPVESRHLVETVMKYGNSEKRKSPIRPLTPDCVALLGSPQLSVPSELSGRDRELAESLLLYLRTDDRFCAPSLTITETARHLRTNTTYLASAIRASWNTTFTDLVNAMRLFRFTTLATKAECKIHSIGGIATSSGFSGTSSFYRIFVNVFNCTPKEWMDEQSS